MSWSEARLEGRARLAYERGRLAWALRRGWFVPMVASLALFGCEQRAATLACIGLLAATVVGLLWRGGAYAHGVGPGLLAGLAPFLLPVAAQATGHACAATLCVFLPTFCIAGGVVGGVVLGAQGHRLPAEQRGFWVSAVVVAALAGSVGCLVAGLAGVTGMALGLALGAAPALALRAA